MGLFNRGQVKELQTKLTELEKQVLLEQRSPWPTAGQEQPGEKLLEKNYEGIFETTPRPFASLQPLQYSGVQYPPSAVNLFDLRQVGMASDVVSAAIQTYQGDVLRRGIRWVGAFVSRCTRCHIDYSVHVDRCTKCGSNDMEKPDPAKHFLFDRFMTATDHNGTTMLELLRMLILDLMLHDDAYALVRKRYITTPASKMAPDGILASEVDEIIRGDPLRMRFVADARGNLGNVFWVCLDCRTHDIDKGIKGALGTEPGYTLGEVKSFIKLSPAPGTCDVHGVMLLDEAGHPHWMGKPLHEVFYVATDGSLAIREAYIKGEVVHVSAFTPSLTYGRSPMLGVWKQIVTRLRMIQFVNEYYRYFRHPRGMLMAYTDNPTSFYKFWDSQRNQMRTDPWHIPVMAIEKKDGRGQFEWVKFSPTLDEVQWSETFDKLEVDILKSLGVLRAEDEEAGKGSQYYRLSDRAVKTMKACLEGKLFPRLLLQFGIADWRLEVQSMEEKSSLEAMDLKLKEIEIAERMFQLGAVVTLKADGGFEFSGGVLRGPPQQGGDAPGMPPQKDGDEPEEAPDHGVSDQELDELLASLGL